MNNKIYSCYEAELWRQSTIQGGWYNAFGSSKIGRSRRKRWNIKICERGGEMKSLKLTDTKSSDKRLPADVVVGLIESNKIKSQQKQCGFWMKGWDGFGFYGWNGKIFHKKTRGKAYGKPFYCGSVIGIELDMNITPGMDLDKKSKPKTNLVARNNDFTKIGTKGGVIKFYVDDEDLGVAFYDLDLNQEFSLAVSLNNDLYTLQLLD